MRIIFFNILFIFSSGLCLSQTADELNTKSKEYLSKQDFKSAVPLIQKAAEMGNAEAQYNYGVCFQQGTEVSRDDSLANEWFLKSAEQGWKDAQFKVAYSYATGRGIQQDYKKAFEWSLKCAAQNDPECMFNVISCYLEGMGTIKNTDSMLVWATRLAVLETPEDLELSGMITSARANLAGLYRDGNYDVPKDLIKSYTWFLIYNESKRDFSILVQQQHIDEIKKLEQRLNEEDKSKAKLEAEKLLGRPLKNLENIYRQDY